MTLNLVATPVDELIVLTTGPRKRATKTHLANGETLPYNAGATFNWRPFPVTSVRDVYEVLKQIAPDPHQLVIRGAPKDRTKDRVNRAIHKKGDRSPDWKAANPGRRWVMFDFDDIPVTWSPTNTQPVIEAARRRLPAPFHQVSCAWRMSASAGLESFDEASVHLWFWLDRPVCDYSVREWAEEGRGVDASLFNPVQPHYVVDPIFEGRKDPLEGRRLGFLQGETSVVATPAEWLDFPSWQRLADRRAAELEAALPPPTKEDADVPDAARRYVMAALNHAVAEIRDQTKGNRHPTVVKCAFAIGGYVGAGYIDRATVEMSLVAAIQAVVPRERHESEANTVRELLDAGEDKPRLLRKTWRIPWLKTDNEGKPFSCVENTEVMLAHYGVRTRYNLMTRREEITLKNYSGAADRKQNAAVAQVREFARRHGLKDGPPLDDHLTLLVANDHYHPVAEWIRSREWDGISRIDALFDSLDLRFPQRDLMLRVFRVWAATATRAALLDASATHGVASQFVFILQGPGGKNKTRWIMSLVPPGTEWAREGATLDPHDKDSVQQATANWIVELGEIDATFKKDFLALKAFVTSRTDTYRGSYDRKAETLARRTVFAGSVNEQCFLQDDTGNRKFIVVGVHQCNPNHGLDMQQFWAEMATLPPMFLSPEDEIAVEKSNRRYEVASPMADICAFYWTKASPTEGKWYSLKEILAGIDHERQWTSVDQIAASKALRNKMKAPSKVVKGYRVFCVKSTGRLIVNFGDKA